ncbi:LamG domain-containing protein [Streptomyces aurantiogriseus]|uniref:LamG domain-containing protein n=1 Tax=Streptomyces aurantiogriseus TaxID=66870 RepID=UPI001E2B0587|nr:LamG domain-containing protein [Streptomyces aurantiogriseus]
MQPTGAGTACSRRRSTTPSRPAPGALVIGRATCNGRPSDFFPGAIRDVRVFDRALAAARIKTPS